MDRDDDKLVECVVGGAGDADTPAPQQQQHIDDAPATGGRYVPPGKKDAGETQPASEEQTAPPLPTGAAPPPGALPPSGYMPPQGGAPLQQMQQLPPGMQPQVGAPGMPPPGHPHGPAMVPQGADGQFPQTASYYHPNNALVLANVPPQMQQLPPEMRRMLETSKTVKYHLDHCALEKCLDVWENNVFFFINPVEEEVKGY